MSPCSSIGRQRPDTHNVARGLPDDVYAVEGCLERTCDLCACAISLPSMLTAASPTPASEGLRRNPFCRIGTISVSSDRRHGASGNLTLLCRCTHCHAIVTVCPLYRQIVRPSESWHAYIPYNAL